MGSAMVRSGRVKAFMIMLQQRHVRSLLQGRGPGLVPEQLRWRLPRLHLLQSRAEPQTQWKCRCRWQPQWLQACPAQDVAVAPDHVIDTTRIDGVVGATDQPDPREEAVDAVCHDDLRISKDENLKLPANLRVALAGEHGKRWAKAWGKEASSFKEGKTFTTIKVKDMPRSARGCA